MQTKHKDGDGNISFLINRRIVKNMYSYKKHFHIWNKSTWRSLFQDEPHKQSTNVSPAVFAAKQPSYAAPAHHNDLRPL